MLWLLSASPARANSWPPMAIWLLQVPLSAGLISYGLGLVAIVLLESFILSQREQLPLGKAIRLSLGANLISLIMGILVILGIGGLPYGAGWWLLVPACFLLIGFSQGFFAHLKLRSPHFDWLISPWPGTILWGIFWFGTLLAGLLLISIVPTINPVTTAGGSFPDPGVPLYINALQLLAVTAFLAIGFTISLITEGFYLGQFLPKPSPNLGQTTLIMNLRSYAYIAVPITVYFMIAKRG